MYADVAVAVASHFVLFSLRFVLFGFVFCAVLALPVVCILLMRCPPPSLSHSISLLLTQSGRERERASASTGKQRSSKSGVETTRAAIKGRSEQGRKLVNTGCLHKARQHWQTISVDLLEFTNMGERACVYTCVCVRVSFSGIEECSVHNALIIFVTCVRSHTQALTHPLSHAHVLSQRESSLALSCAAG